MENMPNVLDYTIELIAFSFKHLQTPNKKTELKQEYTLDKIGLQNKEAEFKIIIKQYFKPASFFKSQAEYKITLLFSKEIDEDLFENSEFKEMINNKIKNAFADNSFLISFFTDRVFSSPLIIPPYPMEESRVEISGDKNM